MVQKNPKTMEFKVLGKNDHDCGFVLTGRIQTDGVSICSKIEHELREGTLNIDIKNDEIHFIFEGVNIEFSERPERLLAVEKMFEKGGNFRIEPRRDSNYEGFSFITI